MSHLDDFPQPQVASPVFLYKSINFWAGKSPVSPNRQKTKQTKKELDLGPWEEDASVELGVDADQVVVHKYDPRLRLGSRQLPGRGLRVGGSEQAQLKRTEEFLFGHHLARPGARGTTMQLGAAASVEGCSARALLWSRDRQTFPQSPSSITYKRSLTHPAATLSRSLSVSSPARGSRKIPTPTCATPMAKREHSRRQGHSSTLRIATERGCYLLRHCNLRSHPQRQRWFRGRQAEDQARQDPEKGPRRRDGVLCPGQIPNPDEDQRFFIFTTFSPAL